jgi:hypothetical protein
VLFFFFESENDFKSFSKEVILSEKPYLFQRKKFECKVEGLKSVRRKKYHQVKYNIINAFIGPKL